MPVSKTRAAGLINAYEVGFVEGGGGGVANVALLQNLLGEGNTVYFPAGVWEFDGTVTLTGQNDFAVIGDGEASQLIKLDRSRFFQLSGCHRVTFRGLNVRGPNWDTGPVAAGDGALTLYDYEPFYIYNDSKMVTVDNCIVSGFSTARAAIYFTQSHHIKVTNNTLFYNRESGHSTTSLGWDIMIQGDDVKRSTDVLIQGNRCYSNNNGGISAIKCTSSYTISDNHIITMDENLVELKDETNEGCERKEGITAVYNVTVSDSTREDDSHCVVANNIIRNTRWSGIYCNLNNTNDASNRDGGVSGVISGNRIHNVCFENSLQDNVKQNGITVENAQQCVVSDNVITMVRGVFYDPYTTDFPNAAIHVASPWVETDHPAGNSPTESQITVADNIISHVEGRGIYVYRGGSSYVITGNSVSDCVVGVLRVSNECSGDLTISNNLFKQTANGLCWETKTDEDAAYFVRFDGFLENVNVDAPIPDMPSLTFHSNQIIIDRVLPNNGGTDTYHLVYIVPNGFGAISFQGNTFKGAPDGTNMQTQVSRTRAYYFASTPAGRQPWNISGDVYRNLFYAITSTSAAAGDGPYLVSNATCHNVYQDIPSGNRDYWYFGSRLGAEQGQVEVNLGSLGSTTAGPAWIVGDRRIDGATLDVCTTAGTGSAAVWTNIV